MGSHWLRGGVAVRMEVSTADFDVKNADFGQIEQGRRGFGMHDKDFEALEACSWMCTDLKKICAEKCCRMHWLLFQIVALEAGFGSFCFFTFSDPIVTLL